jgi:hypothetical protein
MGFDVGVADRLNFDGRYSLRLERSADFSDLERLFTPALAYGPAVNLEFP